MPVICLYTLEQIKDAFWKTFHKSGDDWFFDYLGTEEECEQSTETYWQEFMYDLKAVQTRKSDVPKPLEPCVARPGHVLGRGEQIPGEWKYVEDVGWRWYARSDR